MSYNLNIKKKKHFKHPLELLIADMLVGMRLLAFSVYAAIQSQLQVGAQLADVKSENLLFCMQALEIRIIQSHCKSSAPIFKSIS